MKRFQEFEPRDVVVGGNVGEEITGRTVQALVSGMDTQADVVSEVFYLEPAN